MTAVAWELKSPEPPELRVAVLGDSRVFDTYYATDAYNGSTYGYHQTFPHVLQRRLARLAGSPHAVPGPAGYDCVHIPDHFRGRTVQNNILRLALTDPDCIVLCDGIWESLLSRKHFAEYFESRSEPVPAYSDARLTELFLDGQLALSPAAYSDRIGRIASWFIRRRRSVIWLTTPVPPKGFLGGLHYAGSYRPFEGWHDCLAALNAATSAAVGRLGGRVVDMDALMERSGGAEVALIDQWHFSARFHERIAETLLEMVGGMSPRPASCLSRRVIVQGLRGGLEAGLVGDPQACRVLALRHPLMDVRCEVRDVADCATSDIDCWIVVEEPGESRENAARAIMASCDPSPVVLYPEELDSLDNPAVADRSAFGALK